MKKTQSLQQQVIEFHRAFDQPIAFAPTTAVPDDRVRLRAKLITEEFFETIESLFSPTSNIIVKDDLEGDYMASARLVLHESRDMLYALLVQGDIEVNLTELADGLADLDYVVEGTRLEFGIDGASIAEEVHKTNMAKVGGPVSPEGKHLKPAGWKPPDIAMILELQKQWQVLGEIVVDYDDARNEEADNEHHAVEK